MSSIGQATAKKTKRLSEEGLETIQRLERKQSKFKKLVTTSKDYSKIEKAVVNLDTVAEFDAFWQKTNDAKDDFDQSHERGCGLFSKRYQSSAVVVRSFMKDFSPIIEIVQDFAAPYGGMAVGTISVLFAVAGNKDEIEEHLASAISAIRDRLPGLNLYQHIYNEKHELDTRLQAQIVLAYQGFIEFCIEASTYYKSGGPQQKAKIETLHDQIGLLQKAQDDKTLTEIQRLLSLSTFSEENQRRDLDQYCEALESDEQLNAAYFEQMRGPRFDAFRVGKDYQSWNRSEDSCLLILSGYNNKSIVHLDQCWLSPVAMAMISELRLSPSHLIYAYYVFGPQGELLYRPLSVVLLQLLRQKRRVLRNEAQCDELRAELYELQEYIHGDNKVMEADDERISAFYKVALRVIGFFEESETVHVILDRVDRCCDLKKRVDYRKPLLKALVRMVEASRCKLRVLVVINGYQWRVERRQGELEEKMNGKVIVHTAEQGDSA